MLSGLSSNLAKVPSCCQCQSLVACCYQQAYMAYMPVMPVGLAGQEHVSGKTHRTGTCL